MGGSLVNDSSHLVRPGFLAFVVIQVTGVVTELGDVWRDDLCQSVVLLQVDREIGVGFGGDIDDGPRVGGAIDSDPDDIRSSFMQIPDLGRRGRNVAGRGGCHALDGDR